MNALSLDYQDSMRACLSLVQRHAPKFMRLGGGGLKAELRGRITAAEEAAICACYAETQSIKECTLRAGRSWDACRVVLKRNGVALVVPGAPAGNQNARKPETQQAVDEYFATDPAFRALTLSAIARRHRVDESGLRRLVRKENERRAAA